MLPPVCPQIFACEDQDTIARRVKEHAGADRGERSKEVGPGIECQKSPAVAGERTARSASPVLSEPEPFSAHQKA
jgi:hypothetical protein